MPELAVGTAACSAPDKANQFAALRVGVAFFREAATGRHPLEVSRAVHKVKLDCEAGGVGDCAGAMRLIRGASQLMEAAQSQREFRDLANVSPGERRWGAYAVGTLFTFAKLRKETPSLADVQQKYGAALGLLHEVQWIAQHLEEIRNGNGLGTADQRVAVARVLAITMDAAAALAGTLPQTDAGTAQKIADARVAFRSAARLTEAGSAAEVAVALVEFLPQLNQLEPNVTAKLPKAMTQSLGLLAQLASAKSSDEVAKTLEAAAAPVGSYRTKFDGAGVTINAFLGAAVGAERVSGVDKGFSATVGSVFAPVGLHATVPVLPESTGNRLHLGGMVSILDLGAVASVRLDAESRGEVAEEQRMTLRQVFSPGAYLTVGMLRAPLILGGGVSMVPDGRTVEVPVEGADPRLELRPAVRAMVFVGMDLTLFSF
jgi:hypothetical protein